jgi:hypothetical protein
MVLIMLIDHKVLLGGLAVLIGFLSYIPYFRDILRNKTKPHAFSWLVWSVLTGIAFSAQIVKGGGAGSWINAGTALMCFAVFILAIFKGEKDIKSSDVWSLIGAGVGIALWFITNNPVLAVILITLIDALGFIPTFRKSFYKPHEETLSTFVISTIKYAISLVALSSFTLTTWLFPASLVLTNGLFVVMLIIRRKVISTSSALVDA